MPRAPVSRGRLRCRGGLTAPYVTPQDRCSRRLPCFSSSSCVFHLFVAFHHGIIRIASALVVVMFSKLGLVRGCRLFFVSVDLLSDQPDRSLLSCLLRGLLSDPAVFNFPSHSLSSFSVHFIDPLACSSEAIPNPTRAIVTVGFGSFPNIPKISSVLCWTDLSYFFSTIQLLSEGYDSPPKPTPPTGAIEL